MKAAMFVILLAAGTARAKVIECPAKHHGARLVGAGMYEGEQKEAELMGAPRKVHSGFDVDHGFHRGDVKWLSCVYQPATIRWFKVSPTATRCNLKTREAAPGRVTAVVRCK